MGIKNFADGNFQELQKQKIKLMQLMALCKKYPDLPVIPMVDSEICFEDYGYWTCSIGAPKINKVISFQDRIYFRDEETDACFYDIFFDGAEEYDENISDEDAKKKVDALPWMKCIVVYITMPEYRIPEAKHGED